jgi:hypothetical protein
MLRPDKPNILVMTVQVVIYEAYERTDSIPAEIQKVNGRRVIRVLPLQCLVL